MSQAGDPGVDDMPQALIFAIDVLGGQFAINGGALPADLGDMCFLGGGSLRWESTGVGYSAFVVWALNGGLDDFYHDVRWPEWAAETERLTPLRVCRSTRRYGAPSPTAMSRPLIEASAH